MLDEKKIRRMTRLASYETKDGKKEIEISSYFRRDYVSMNVIRSIFWVTLGYIATLFLVAVTYMSAFIEDFSLSKLVIFLIVALVVYIVLVVGYAIGTTIHYRRKHTMARSKVKEFCHGLFILEKMYKKEIES